MRLRLLFSAALLYAAIPATAQVVPNTTGAPFIAQRTSTSSSSNGLQTTVGTIARRSDGSTYVELKSPEGKGLVLITDVPHHRTIELYLDHHFFTVYPSPDLLVQTLPAGYAAHYMESAGQPGSKRTNGEWQITTLSHRKIGDVDTVGFSEQKADGRIFERWYSPVLYMNVETKQHDPEHAADSEMRLQNVRLIEPDAKLFEVPPGYVEYKNTPNGPRPIEP
jgi:hypothetical protein